MTSFVLVPGACHGGWWFQPLADELRKRGHLAHAITLPGLADRADLLNGSVTLDTHVDDLAATICAEGIEDAVLVGHSYGGSVISGVADRIPERINGLMYLDAFVPEDGESCWSITDDDHRRWFIEGASRTGIAIDPQPFFDERATPHPLATVMQRSRLTGGWQSVAVKHYVAATGWPGRSQFASTAERLRADAAWTVHDLPTGHNVMVEAPDQLLELVLSVA
ncbi:MAG: alpha/beta fold hydrolase [Mycobacteriaceae bacterium]